MTRDYILINCPSHSEEQNEHNLIYWFCLQTFFFMGDCGDFQCMSSCFVAKSKCWFQLSMPIITHPITSSPSAVLFSHLRQISIRWSLYSRVRKWGTQQAATLRIFNFLHRIVWRDNFEISRAWASCLTVMWRSSQTTAATVFIISLYKCSMAVQHGEAMQQFLRLWRRPYAYERLSNL